jgi:hypothetical protein
MYIKIAIFSRFPDRSREHVSGGGSGIGFRSHECRWSYVLPMTRPTDLKRWVQSTVGTLMVSMIQFVCAPDTAWAGCNHLVSSQSDTLLDLNQLDAFIAPGSTALSPRGLTQHQPPQPVDGRHAPCSGLSCSSRNPSLPASTTLSDPTSSDQWGSLSARSALDTASPRPGTTCEPSPDSSGENSLIFHPPRSY